MEDTEKEMLKALQELDHDADGFIPKEDMIQFLTGMGETFKEEEVMEFLKYAINEEDPTDDMIDINRLCKVLLPKISTRIETQKA